MATETLAAATKLSATHASLLSARREAIQLSQAGYTAQEKNSMTFISDSQRLIGAHYKSGHPISTYDDGFGRLYVHRNSLGISGIVRAQTWEDAYSICEDEFFPEADETLDEIIKEYGFKREYKKVIKTSVFTPESERDSRLGPYEKFAELSDYSDNGRLPEGLFVRWETIETPDPDAWVENELFQEGFGFRPNGPNSHDKLNHGIYAKDLNGDRLDVLTPELADELEIELEIETGE